MLKLADIRRSYSVGEVAAEVLRGVDLEVGEGDLLSIMGPSGSGKTTLMNIIGLLDRPDSGACILNGRDVQGLRDDELSALRNRHIGFVFQSFHLLPQLTALENVCLPLVYRGAPRSRMSKLAGEILERVGMADKTGNRPDQLSGGRSSAWPSPGRSSGIRRWCWPTSPPARWTPTPPARSWRCLGG